MMSPSTVSVEVSISFVPPKKWLMVALSVTEAVSGVEGLVGGRDVDEGPAESDLIQTRRACLKTSWVTTRVESVHPVRCVKQMGS